jgi:hypothetical protein
VEALEVGERRALEAGEGRALEVGERKALEVGEGKALEVGERKALEVIAFVIVAIFVVKALGQATRASSAGFRAPDRP